jgi:hypothetical protein
MLKFAAKGETTRYVHLEFHNYNNKYLEEVRPKIRCSNPIF